MGTFEVAESGFAMSFATERQRARACRALLRTIEMDHLWTVEGPTDEAIELFDNDFGPHSSGEKIIMSVAWDLWGTHRRKGGTPFDEIMYRLDGDRLNVVATFLAAYNAGELAIDDWIAEQGNE